MTTEEQAAAKFMRDMVNSVGRKDDGGKPNWTLMPWEQLAEVQKVLDHGAKKYGDWNWIQVENPQVRYLAALFRHLIAYTLGHDNDEDSGHPHLAHAVCCALFLMHFDMHPNDGQCCNEKGCLECQKP